MAKITWTFKNEEGTNLNRYIATNVSTGEKITFDLLRGGNISVVGTPLNAENLNALITSINACYDLISSSEKDTTYTLSKNGNAIRLTSSDGTTNDVTLNKSDVGLSNVDNTSDMDKPISNATKEALSLKANASDLTSHTSNTNNPHNVTASQVGAYTKDEMDNKLNEIKEEFEHKIVECNCTHEVEITGFGEEDCNLVIEDQDVVISKIQGQTRRKSFNLLNIADVSETTTNGITYSVKNGVITLNGTSTKSGTIELIIPINVKLSGENNTFYFVSNSGTRNGNVGCYLFNNIGSWTFDTWNFNSYTSTYNGSLSKFGLWITQGCSFNNYKIYPMLTSGTTKLNYFEPYDNNLVNSKCDFVSTGRNLLPNSHNIIITGGEYVLIPNLKPNTTYTISNTSSLGEWIILLDDNSSFGGWTTKQSITFKTQATTNNTRYYFNTSNDDVNIMLNYGDTALPYEPYIEDTMQCGLELGAFDYHDNINHITHRQTSEMITLTGTESGWESVITNTSDKPRFRKFLPTKTGVSTADDIGVASNWIDASANQTWICSNGISVDLETVLVYVEGITTVEDFKSWLQANPITFVYKLSSETTEENILPSGYKVWYKGMQIQKTETLPYILTKQYAISLSSQVLNNVSIDRSQQKQIDELKTISENKVNAVYFEIERQISNVDNFITYLNNSNINIGDYVGKIMIFRTSIGDDEFDYIIIPSYYDYTGFLVCEDNIYHLYFNGDTYAVGKYLLENEINNKFGGFKFTKKGSSNVMYAGEDSTFTLISNYDEETQTEGTVVGNIDSETIIRGVGARPSYTNGFTTSQIALSTDLDDILLRLDDLGFKRGVASINGATATTNTLKKQGKYCIFNLVLESYAIQAKETKTITVTIPVGFRPKEETKINFTYFDNIPSMTTLEKFLEITVGTDGIIVISITAGNYGNNIMFPKILNAGWELA